MVGKYEICKIDNPTCICLTCKNTDAFCCSIPRVPYGDTLEPRLCHEPCPDYEQEKADTETDVEIDKLSDEQLVAKLKNYVGWAHIHQEDVPLRLPAIMWRAAERIESLTSCRPDYEPEEAEGEDDA